MIDAAQKMVRTIADGWANLLTGLGTTQDRTKYTRYVAGCEHSPAELTDIYRFNWLARRVVDGLPERALARGTTEAGAWPEGFDALNWANPQWDEGALLRSICLGRLYGGAATILGYAGGPLETEAPAPDAGGLAWLDVATRHELQVAQGPDGRPWRDYDPRSPTYGRPLVYEVIGAHPRRGLRFHTSRLILWGGVSRPPPLTARGYTVTRDQPHAQDELDWSDSVLTSVWDDVQRYGVMWQSISHLVDVASTGVIKMRGLLSMLGQESQETIRRRIDIMNTSMSLTRNLMLDSEGGEDYSRVGVSFAGLPELLQELQLATAGAVDMPVTELFGRAPAGLNATGESDAKKYNASVKEWQTRVLQPRANRLASAIKLGAKVEFGPIEIPSETEEAELRNAEVQATERYWTMGVFSDQEIRDAVIAGEWVEAHTKPGGKVPEDPTRPVVQVKSESSVEGQPSGPAPRTPPRA